MSPSIPQKQCIKCLQEFPATLEYWHKAKENVGGLKNICKTCSNAKSREYHNEHHSEIRIRQTVYYYDNHEYNLVRSRKYHSEHKQEHSIRFKIYYQENAAYMRDKSSNYRETNYEQVLMTNRIRANKKRANGGTHTKDDIRRLIDYQDNKCWWCDCLLDDHFHIDHVNPIYRGGDNFVENIVISCPTCNMSKGDKTPLEWLRL